MSGYLPPPTPPGKLGFSTGTLVPVSKAGAIIEVGQGLYGRIDPATGQLALDAVRLDPPEEFSLFAPGAVAVKTLGVWRNTRASGRSLGLALEANLMTAPTAGDANNYYAVRAADAAGTNMVLPISTAGQAHYSLNDGSGVAIARPWAPAAGAPSGDGTTLALGVNFTPTQDLTVTGMVAALNLSNFSDTANYGARPVTASILDANGNVITSAQSSTPGGTGVSDIQFAFPLAVVLKAGTWYFMVVDEFTAGAYNAIAGSTGNASSATDPGMATGNRSSQSAPLSYPGGNPNGGVSVTIKDGVTPRSSIAALTWPQIIQQTGVGTSIHWNNFGSQLGCIGLLGTGAGAAFGGDVTLSIVTAGTPVAGAAGADLNARLLLGVA